MQASWSGQSSHMVYSSTVPPDTLLASLPQISQVVVVQSFHTLVPPGSTRTRSLVFETMFELHVCASAIAAIHLRCQSCDRGHPTLTYHTSTCLRASCHLPFCSHVLLSVPPVETDRVALEGHAVTHGSMHLLEPPVLQVSLVGVTVDLTLR